MTTAPAQPPVPKDPLDVARWDHTRLRLRMITGHWRGDLQSRVREQVGDVRASAWGVGQMAEGRSSGGVDMSSSILLHIANQLSVLYDRPPVIYHADDAPAGVIIEDLLESAGFASVMQTLQRDTIALREMLLRVDADKADGVVDVHLRPVAPCFVVAEPDERHPDRPGMVSEARLRRNPATGATEWTWDVWDARKPLAPVRKVMSADMGTDVSGDYAVSGWPDRHRDASGAPVLPYVLYHAAKGATLWDAHHGAELVEGTMQAGVYLSHLAHAMVQASWPQRYSVGIDWQGASNEGRRDVIVADPSTILVGRPAESDVTIQTQIGQWQAGADIGTMMDAVERYERRVVGFAGLSASDLLRVSGDPRSGYAIAVSREGKREASQKFEPVFGASDRLLCRIVATLHNRLTSGSLPESGYRIAYQGLPLSADERRARLEEIEKMRALGLISPAQEHEMAAPLLRELGVRDLVLPGIAPGPDLAEPAPAEADAPTP